jgi:hypothetical protein
VGTAKELLRGALIVAGVLAVALTLSLVACLAGSSDYSGTVQYDTSCDPDEDDPCVEVDETDAVHTDHFCVVEAAYHADLQTAIGGFDSPSIRTQKERNRMYRMTKAAELRAANSLAECLERQGNVWDVPAWYGEKQIQRLVGDDAD